MHNFEDVLIELPPG